MPFKRRVNDFKRLRFIVGTLSEEGFDFLLRKLELKYLVPFRSRLKRWSGRFGGRRKEEEKIREPLPVRLRLVLEKLGPTFIKFGQVLSLRPDLIPAEYAEEFKKLQDQVPPFSFSQAKKIIEKDLDQPLE